MASFVLVHGSGQNASCWSRVSSILRGRGHLVEAPDLPKQASEWSLADYARAISNSMAGPRSIVVGHSFSGAFLPLLPRMEDCQLLVFLAAVVPEPGKSVRDQFQEDPGMFRRKWIEASARWFDPSQQESLAEEFLFHDCDAETLSWALRTVEFMSTQHLLGQPCPLEAWPSVRAVSIVATEDRTLSADWGRRISRRVLGRPAIEVRAGHCPQASQPERIAGLLEQMAARGDP